MKKTVIAIVVALTCFATVAQAALVDNNTWYAGGKLGWSQFNDTGWNRSLSNNALIHKSQLGIGSFGGYQVNSYVGFEMGYDWLGRIPYKINDTTNGEFKANGVQLTVKLDYPLADDLDVYTRLGGMVWRTSFSDSIVGIDHETGISPVFVGGVEWAMNKNVAARLEYQWVNNISDSNVVGIRPNNSMLGLGVSYRFGQQETTQTTVPMPTLIPEETKTKNFTLKTDVLFNFNKTSLDIEGKKSLDQLYTQLSNLNLKDGSIVVSGFTDRIGSIAYNQFISEKRAQSVVDYLILKGIPGNKISLRGMCKSNSITGNICDSVKDRNKLIKCLAPDRRVEIEIKDIKDTTT